MGHQEQHSLITNILLWAPLPLVVFMHMMLAPWLIRLMGPGILLLTVLTTTAAPQETAPLEPAGQPIPRRLWSTSSSSISQAMPLNIDQRLINALVKRQIAEEPLSRPRDSQASSSTSELSPQLLHALGSIADGFTTAHFLHTGRAEERTPLYQRFKNDPLKTGLAVAGTGVTQAIIATLLKKTVPALAPLLDAYSANKAAYRVNAASEGVILPERSRPEHAFNDYETKITHAIRRTSR